MTSPSLTTFVPFCVPQGAPAAIQGFNNATYDPTPGGELTLFPPISAVSGPAPPGARPQFEPLPELTAVAAHPVAHPRPAIYNLSVSRGFSAKDWFGEYLGDGDGREREGKKEK